MTESAPDLDHFAHDDAWEVGSALVARCRVEKLPVTISIWLVSNASSTPPGPHERRQRCLGGEEGECCAPLRPFVLGGLRTLRRRLRIPSSSRRSDSPAPSTLPARARSRSESAAAWSASSLSPAWRLAATTSWRSLPSAAFTTEHSTRAAVLPPCSLRPWPAGPGCSRMLSPLQPDGTPTCPSRHPPDVQGDP